MNKSRVLSIFLAVMMLSSVLAATVLAASTAVKTKTQSLSLQFDGQALKLPDGQYSFIYQGRTYVPIRYISYALQKSVNWDGKKATVSEPTEQELAAMKKQLQHTSTGSDKPQAGVEITIQPVNAALVFDGKAAPLPAGQPLFGYKGSIYVPLRFLSESVGTQISFDPVTKTVNGQSAAYRAEQGAGGGNLIPGTGEGSAGGTGGAGGGAVKLSYEQITAEAESKLAALKSSCKSTLMSIGLQYISTSDAAVKAQLKAQGLQEVDNCSAKFEVIMSDTTAKLTENGYSTAIIADYRKAFQAELEAGRDLANSMG
ncbi:stalk domain-containing protein [Paenibacillus sp. Soil522]|uniref:stalk domain-containing protein n=1 Tax=Paenibacillus sp. Soil522 TaxID=1736388 RepID=UPI0006F75A89|nr:stalk domain-containing protein [Paenibacillus sp. Soil522]KRE47923.1 hypothetical protein ASG81_08395 [Paenibacillus sp. Soil522]